MVPKFGRLSVDLSSVGIVSFFCSSGGGVTRRRPPGISSLFGWLGQNDANCFAGQIISRPALQDDEGKLELTFVFYICISQSFFSRVSKSLLNENGSPSATNLLSVLVRRWAMSINVLQYFYNGSIAYTTY